jgi:hypothetical protein
MPKELIYDESYGVRVPLDGPEGATSTLHLVSDAFLKVGWGRETSHVQVAVCTDGDPDGMEAQHLSLDRAGINRLIRTLRKARDAAYGSDA